MTASLLHIYTLGTVAINKPLDSKDIEFTPNEDMLFMDGELTDNASEETSKGTNAAGQAYEKSLTTTSTMKATWLPLGDANRRTAPDVRRGEIVVIYQYGDADKYYWTTLNNDLKLRKRETVIYAWSNVVNEEESERADNTYFVEVSTHGKYIHVHTSKNDGEPFAYDIQLNTKEGFFQITDDVGNLLEIDSRNTKITMFNIDQSYVILDKQVITANALDTINLIAGKNVNIKAGSQINIEAGSRLFETAPSIVTESNSTVNNVPTTTNTGTQTTVGTTTTGGLMSVPTGGSTGGFSATGDGTINGSVVINGQVTAQVGNFPGGVNAPNV